MKGEVRTNIISAISLVAALAVIIGLVIDINYRRENARRLEENTRILQEREPNVLSLDVLILPTEDSYRIVVPIRNRATSQIADAHRVQVALSFDPENTILDVQDGPYRLLGGGIGSSTVSFEINVLPSLSTLYLVVVVEKPYPPAIEIGWAEKTGWQAYPPATE